MTFSELYLVLGRHEKSMINIFLSQIYPQLGKFYSLYPGRSGA
jgi:hypothetical protein